MSQRQQEYRALVRSELQKDRAHGMQNAARIWRERREGRRNPDGGTLLKWGAIGGLVYLVAKHFGAAPQTPPPGQLGVTGDAQQGAVRSRTGGV